MSDGPVANTDCKLYFSPDDGVSPTWTEIKFAKNANCDVSATTDDTSSRASTFATENVTKLKVGPLTFDYQIISGTDSVASALRAAFLAKTHLRFAQMDGPIATAGSQGWTAWMQLTKFPINEGDTATRKSSCEAVPCLHMYADAIVDPAYLEVS